MNQLFTILILMVLAGCSTEAQNTDSQTETTKPRYLRWVGDSVFDPETDRDDFQLCHSENHVKQYFNFSQGLRYKGEKKALVKHFMESYRPVDSDQSGWIRVRFIINCKGETGRFRMTGANENYKEQAFDQSITGQLLELSKALDGWEVQPNEEKPKDYYQYLVFKIQNGNLIEIMP